MTTPLLTPIRTPAPRIRAPHGPSLPALPELPVAADTSWFLVAEAGRFGDACWQRGEVLVCRGEARPGDTVVLVARGHGRPRLGRVDGLRFVGDSGEPCHPLRWASAGRIVGSLSHRLDGWVVDLGLDRRRRSVGSVGSVGSARPLGSARGRGLGHTAQLQLPFAA